MSVASKNLYELLGNDPDSDGEIKAPPKKEVVKKTPTTKKKDVAPEPVAAPAQNDRGGYRGRGGRGGRTYGGNEAAFRDRGANRESNRARYAEEGGAPRPSGRGRGGRGGRGRDFDRHSATGRVDSEKAVSQGWGSTRGENEWADEKAGEAIAQNETATASAWDEPPAQATEGEATEQEPAAPEEPEEKQKTYEDYLAEKLAKQAALGSLPEARQPNEGSRDNKKWKNATPLTRKEEDEVLFAPTTEKTKKIKERKEKQVVDIDQRFQDVRENRRGGDRGGRGGRGDRGGRGGPRGERRGGGGDYRPRGNYNGSRTVDIDDTSAFPSLGS